MLTICLIYSNDRIEQATQVVDYLSLLPNSSKYEKILLVDEYTTFKPLGYRIELINRVNDWYCRANVWNHGINIARNDRIIMMDCDRITHRSFFEEAEKVPSNEFVYARQLYKLRTKCSLPDLLGFLDEQEVPPENAVVDFKFGPFEKIVPGKNPISGCVAFLKQSYLSTKGMSKQFRGWGFNDTDCFMTLMRANKQFRPLNVMELHLHHEYAITKLKLQAMNAWNGVYFYDKWFMQIPQAIRSLLLVLNADISDARKLSLEEFVQKYGN